MRKPFALFVAVVLCLVLTNVCGSESYCTPTDLSACETQTDMYSYSLPDPVPYIAPATCTDLIFIDYEEEPLSICSQDTEAIDGYTQQVAPRKNKNKRMYTIQMLDVDMVPITDLIVIGSIEDDGIIAWIDEFCMYVVIAPVK